MIAFAPQGLQCDVTYSICLLCIGMFFNGAVSSGHFSSFVDLAPNFAGTLFGISNVFSGGIKKSKYSQLSQSQYSQLLFFDIQADNFPHKSFRFAF